MSIVWYRHQQKNDSSEVTELPPEECRIMELTEHGVREHIEPIQDEL